MAQSVTVRNNWGLGPAVHGSVHPLALVLPIPWCQALGPGKEEPEPWLGAGWVLSLRPGTSGTGTSAVCDHRCVDVNLRVNVFSPHASVKGKINNTLSYFSVIYY